MVADLSGRNPNVFYELAIRHAIGKPVVQIIHGSETIPFDVAAIRTIHYNHHDLDSALKAREDITRQIRAVQNNPQEVDTPITAALDLQQFQESDNPLDKSLASLVLMLQEILEIIRGQERRVTDIEKRQTIEGFTHKVGQEVIWRALEPNAGLKEALATMNFDSVLASEVAKYLATKKVGGVLSSDFPENHAEDQKKP